MSGRSKRRDKRDAAKSPASATRAPSTRGAPATGAWPIQLRVAAVILALLGVVPVVAGWTLTLLQPASKAPLVDPLIAVVVTIALAFALGTRAERLLDALRGVVLRPSSTVFVAGACVAAVVLSSVAAWYCFGAQPGILDEMTQRFQSRLLLAGRLSLQAEPLREFFETEQTLSVGTRWFGEFPIGSAVLMVFGDIIRAPWLVNPVFAALSAWGIHRFLSRTTDEITARATTVLFVLSPFVLFMSGSEMNHTKTLTALMLALCGLVEWTRSDTAVRTRWSAVAIGGGVGLIAWMRPYDAVLVAIPIGIFQSIVLVRDRRRASSLPWQLLAGAIPVVVMLWANAATTGYAWQFGYDVFNGTAHRPGFHTDPEGNEFTPAVGLAHIGAYIVQLNAVLLEWPLPVITFVVITLFLRRIATRWDSLLLGLIGSMLVGYGAYWHRGNSFGPRFLFLVVPCFLLYLVQMPAAVASRVRDRRWAHAAWLVMPVSLLMAWSPVAFPWQTGGVLERAATYRHGDFPPQPDIGTQLAEAKLDRALVFVREPWHNRLTARIRVLGMPPLRAANIVAHYDACVLHEALDLEDPPGRGSAPERLSRVARASTEAGRAQPDPTRFGNQSLAFIPGRLMSASCEQELAGDRAGTVPLDLFLAHNDFDADGRLGGRVVFARDLGAHNEALRERFKDRTWYRYRVGADGSASFEPYR